MNEKTLIPGYMNYRRIDKVNVDVAKALCARDSKGFNTGFDTQNGVIETIRIKQATKEGYIEMQSGGVADLSYPNSQTRRGRVQEGGTISPTLTSSNTGIYRVESNYRIRKLTPFECFRLMGVTDSDAKKMLEVNSNSQCYKQAGNSIVVDVMAAMFKKLF